MIEEKSVQSRLGTADKAPAAHHARFRMTIKQNAVLSELYLLTHEKSFVKLRISRTAEAEKETQPKLDALLDEIGKTLAK